ncbi:MAG: hypothetical protein AAFV45_07325 [Pseudomonadota bacterium]
MSAMIRKRFVIAAVATLAIAITGLGLGAGTAYARSDAAAFEATLSTKDRKAFNAYLTAKTFHDADKDAFWAKVSTKRKKRRAKIRKGALVTERDYVTAFPPEFEGPELSKALASKWKAWQTRDADKGPARKRSTLPGVKDFLRNAKRYYGFLPERIPEREFKRRYAAEALRLGLSQEQVVRVYALETGGNGTADMQAGIHPISKKGRPISSALGYAQLLNANSTSELAKHGNNFLKRLERMRDQADNEARRARLDRKITSLRKMVRKAKSIPFNWGRHRKFARTGPGLGIHALNLDGDIGPWLQVIKLKGIKELAERKGRDDLDSTELELMNLAGPSTGLEMMSAIGLSMPTVNFFARRGYERNSVVRGRTSTELLAELKKRMDYNERNSGAKEFVQVFKELNAKQKRAQR